MIEDTHLQYLFGVLCRTEGKRDYEEVEISSPDDDRGSVISSKMGSASAGDRESPVLDDIGDVDNGDTYNSPDWENLNETKRESNIANTLKQLGNIKKKTNEPSHSERHAWGRCRCSWKSHCEKPRKIKAS